MSCRKICVSVHVYVPVPVQVYVYAEILTQSEAFCPDVKGRTEERVGRSLRSMCRMQLFHFDPFDPFAC